MAESVFLFLIEWAHGLCYLFSWVILLLQMISHEYREKQQQCSERKGKKSVLKRQRVRGLRGHKPNTVRLYNRIFTCPCTQTETTWCILLDSSIYCGRQRYKHIYAHTHTQTPVDTGWFVRFIVQVFCACVCVCATGKSVTCLHFSCSSFCFKS